MRRLLLAFSLSIAPLLLAQSEAPDLIIFNARVFTGDPTNPKAQAVAISGDHISAVGTNDQVKSIAGRLTKRIDAQGHVVRRITGPVQQGYQRVAWDLRLPSPTITLGPRTQDSFGTSNGEWVQELDLNFPAAGEAIVVRTRA